MTIGKYIPLFVFALLSGIFLFAPRQVFAVSVSIIDVPATITQDNFGVTASISGAQAGANYVRIDLFKENTNNYFGETYNGHAWYGGSDATQYLPITIQANTPWVGQIQGHIGSPSITEYDGTGNYRLRVRRYTSSGNPGSETPDTVAITIAFPTPTATPMPTNTPIPPTPTSKPTATPVAKTSSVKSVNSSLQTNISPTQAPSPDVSSEQTPSPQPTTAVLGDSTGPRMLPMILIAIGVALFGICGILFFLSWKKSQPSEPTV